MGKLDLGLGFVFLQTEVRVLLEPPGLDLSLADAAQDGEGRRVTGRVFGANFGEGGKVVGKNFGAETKRVDQKVWQVDRDLSRLCVGLKHPHSL